MSSPAPHHLSYAAVPLSIEEMPRPVMAFVQAVNRADHLALIQLFAAGALVNDQLRDFWGLPSISRWIRMEVVGDRLRLKVLSAVRHFESIVLAAEVDGDFDKTGLPIPLVLHLHFTVTGEEISRLIILSSRAADTAPEIRVPRGGA
jgi:hypothetical protein